MTLLLAALLLAAPARAQELTPYASPLLDWALQVPSDWRIAEDSDRIEFLPPSHESTGFSMTLRTTAEPYSPKLVEAWKASMESSVPGFELLGQRETPFGDAIGREFEFRSLGADGERRHLYAFVDGYDRTFQVDCSFPVSSAERYAPTCVRVVGTLRARPAPGELSARPVLSKDGGLELSLPAGWKDVTAEVRLRSPSAVLSLQRPAATLNLRLAEGAEGRLEAYVREGARAVAEKTGGTSGPVERLAAGGVELYASVLRVREMELLTGAFELGGKAYGVESVSRSPGLAAPVVRAVLSRSSAAGPAAGWAAPAGRAPDQGRTYLNGFIFGATVLAFFFGLFALNAVLPELDKRSHEGAHADLPGLAPPWRSRWGDTGPPIRASADWWPVSLRRVMTGVVTWWPVRFGFSRKAEPKALRRVGVVGAGTMGAGLAELLALKGYDVALHDAEPAALRAGLERLRLRLEKAGKPEALSRVEPAEELEMLGACDAVIEAAFEDLGVKRALFRRLGEAVPPPALLATNTSSLSVGEIAAAARAPERVVGMHFFNPAPVMRLVEVVPHAGSSEAAREEAEALAAALGKTPIVCADAPGFAANRLVRPFYIQPIRLATAGEATVSELDEALRRQGFKMGPFELVDLIGLEVNLAITRVLHKALGERFMPPLLQENLVARGCLGRKSGAGYYLYPGGRKGEENPALKELVPGYGRRRGRDLDGLFREVLDEVAEEARRLVAEGVVGEKEADLALTLGFNWPKGPLEWSKELSSSRPS